MKSIIQLLGFTILSITLLGQTHTILLENFSSSTFPPEGWELIDRDGDGKNWYHRTDSQTGNKMASSKSWESSPLTPYNLIISSQVDLSGFAETDRLRLAYKIAATGNSYYSEHYKVVLSTSGNTYVDFEQGTILLEETLGQAQSGWSFATRTIDIEGYAGELFWLAWVHYSCTDEDAILLDDIHIYKGDDPEGDPPYVSWLIGSADDATTENHQAGIVLAGGGGDNNDAMKWFLNRADGGDVVVIRSSGTDGYNNYLFSTLGITVNSVETLLINSREAAEDPYVEEQIRNAEALFIAGGDQYDYFQYWKDTPVMDAINYLVNDKGVTVGGTSAGMAILGKVYYAPSGSSAQSATVLANPYHSSMDIIGRDDFIETPILENTITDTHFDQRERAGRLFTFLSRMVTDWGIEAKGIAANEYVAICIDVDGKAYVYGNPSYEDYAYFLRAQDCDPETCTSGQPLTWSCSQKAVKVYRILGKKSNPDYFDLNDWETGIGGSWHYWHAQNGTLYKSDATSISGIEYQRLLVYPNPTNGIFWIEFDKEVGDSVLEVYCSSGRLLFSQGLSKSTSSTINVDLAGFPNGIYLVKLIASKTIYSGRVAKTD